jgi:pyruvate,water dikinase
MTDPSFLEVADRIAGLITDRGGLVCHAAILAREFRLPCIVGCRNATEVIRDGEPIRMDAFAGIVTRVSR